ncbi:dihydrodipicolinate reductase [Mycobacterium sp. 852002-51057_SCH5723018]|uniref:NAD(P)H-dependent amine dehydrogenase family protein n=1 Tax=Mycobacterium sp. 852002-51057_SCH5723018 TaxID=1834094 RepID=UPI000800B08A|nr:dihydrodipicolinate reductase [Mycobacterium sp. 852002-51057_SCH5723018]OBG27510.1 dihydrodipicolinate reductase [Mycobacterium sp. 852002-51057_SCH5723018]
MVRRIIQFSTGNVGVHALRTIIERPDLELVGVHAAGADKIGRDAADLCGLSDLVGVIATDDVDALVALNADCVMYTSQAETRPQEAMDDVARFLRAGTNVVGSSFVWLVAPDFTDEWLRDPLEKACRDGNSTLYINGIDPGYSGDTLVYTALSLAGRATAVTVQEICDYGSYDDAEFTGVSFGFGTDPQHDPILFAPGILASMWGIQVRSLAADLGVELDEVRERHEKWATPEPISCTMMDVAPGKVAAVRFGVEGIRDGKVVITMEHVNRLTEIAAPQWPYPPDGRPGVHRVIVEGDPGIEINTHVGRRGTDHNQGGVIATAARPINAIEAVCRAPAGILAAHDLRPLDHTRGVMW